jgi:hypothetical protein
MINTDWKVGGLANIFIARRHASGNVTFCVYLVDTYCLGVKDTFFNCNVPPEVLDDCIGKGRNTFSMEEISYDLAHNIIFAALEYAGEYGFKPNKHFTSTTQYFLENDSDNIPLIDIQCGTKDGRPLYVNNGYETLAQAEKIIRQLEKTAGKGNFDVVINGDLAEVFDTDSDSGDGDWDLDAYREKLTANGRKYIEREALSVFTEYLKHTVDGICDDPELSDRAIVLADLWLKENRVINFDLSDEYMKTMREDFSSVKTIASADVPNSLFPTFTTGGQELEFDFINTFTVIYNAGSNSRNAEKQINWFMRKYGDCGAVAYLRILFITNFHAGTPRDVERQYSRFPDYFLVKLLRKDRKLIISPPADRKESKKQLMAMVEGVTLTQFEMMQFIFCYMVHAFDIRNNRTDNLLEKATALLRLIESNTLNYPDFVTEMILVYAEARQMNAAIIEFFKRNPNHRN